MGKDMKGHISENMQTTNTHMKKKFNKLQFKNAIYDDNEPGWCGSVGRGLHSRSGTYPGFGFNLHLGCLLEATD